MRRAIIVASIALSLAMTGLTSHATERRPDILLKAKYTEVKVSFDSAIKSDAALLTNVTDEGRIWASKNLKELIKDRKDLDDAEFKTRPWEVERSYAQVSLVNGRYVSVLRFDYSYVGGAHPNYDNDTILWDRQIGKRISIRSFFNETADDGPTMKAIQQGAIAGVRVAKKEKDIENVDEGNWQGSIGASLLKIGPIVLHPSTVAGKSSGLMVHYPPYAVGPWAEGTFEAFIPWEKLKPYLSAEGAAIFSGGKPETAAKDK